MLIVSRSVVIHVDLTPDWSAVCKYFWALKLHFSSQVSAGLLQWRASYNWFPPTQSCYARILMPTCSRTGVRLEWGSILMQLCFYPHRKEWSDGWCSQAAQWATVRFAGTRPQRCCHGRGAKWGRFRKNRRHFSERLVRLLQPDLQKGAALLGVQLSRSQRGSNGILVGMQHRETFLAEWRINIFLLHARAWWFSA